MAGQRLVVTRQSREHQGAVELDVRGLAAIRPDDYMLGPDLVNERRRGRLSGLGPIDAGGVDLDKGAERGRLRQLRNIPGMCEQDVEALPAALAGEQQVLLGSRMPGREHQAAIAVHRPDLSHLGDQVLYLGQELAVLLRATRQTVGTAERNPMLPNVQTSNEAGLPEFQASAWNGLFAPKATPKPVLERLAGALDKALDDANTRKRLQELGSDIPDKASRGPQPLAALVKREIAKWTRIINSANIKVE
jgi:hypothetical protein